MNMKTIKIILLLLNIAIVYACSKSEISDSNTHSEIQFKQEKNPWLMQDLSGNLVEGEQVNGRAWANFINKEEEKTRTYSELSSDGSYAKVMWNAGDSFYMYSYDESDNIIKFTVYSTENGGAKAEFTYPSAITTSPCYSIYPGAQKISLYNNKLIFGITVPTVQNATAGSVSAGANVSFCKTDSQVSDFQFFNATSIVKFRLSGSIVNSLTSVTLKGVKELAGNSVLMAESDGTPTLTREIYFNDDVSSRSVTLSGTFETGSDYYMTVFPGEQYGFSMSFSDGTNSKTYTTSTHLPLERSVIYDLGTIDVGDNLIQEDKNNAILYMEATSGKTPVSLAVVPDGFTEEELSDFELLAKSGIDAMFSTEPFKTYREYFNVWILKAASNESGSSITDGEGNVTSAKDTYFSSSWGETSYGDMMADLDKVLAFVEDNCPDVINGIHSAIEVPALMIINDTRYGGICHNYYNGRCVAMVPYISGGATMAWTYPDTEAVSESSAASGTRAVSDSEKQALGISTGDWKNVLIHEFGGHGFSRLLDEYWYSSYSSTVSAISTHSWPLPYGLNISASYNNPPWQSALLDQKSSLESSDALYGRIGVYHGGDVSIFNRWRSERVSCMIDNRQYFSTWQRMLIVQRILAVAGETFDSEIFFEKDNPMDPLRDVSSGTTYGSVTKTICNK